MDGATVLSGVDKQLRRQHAPLRFHRVGKRVLYVGQRLQRFLVIAALPPDTGKEEPGAITDVGVDVVGEQLFENFGGAKVVPVGEIQATQQQLRFVPMLAQPILLAGRHQAYDRRKIVFLVEVEQDLAEVRVLDDSRFAIDVSGERLL